MLDVVLGGRRVTYVELKELKRLFCDHVHKRLRQELRMTNDDERLDLSDGELLAFVGEGAPYAGCTLRQGWLDLMELLYQLDGYDVHEAINMMTHLPDEEIAQGLRSVGRGFRSITDWVEYLSGESRLSQPYRIGKAR